MSYLSLQKHTRRKTRVVRVDEQGFPPPCHHMSFSGLRGPPSWAWQECNRLLRLGRPWGAVTLSQWCVSGDRGGCSARRGLKLTNLPRPWSQRESSPSRKIPTVEPGIETGTSWLVVRDSDHYTTRLVNIYMHICVLNFITNLWKY